MDVGAAIAILLGQLDEDRPYLICIAGPNGAGKSTLYPDYIAPILEATGLTGDYLNADEVSKESREASNVQTSQFDADQTAQNIIAEERTRRLSQELSFTYETVFSHESKVEELSRAKESGYVVLVVFVGLQSVEQSEARVQRRVGEGGHDVPREKLETRFPKTLSNLQDACAIASGLLVLDNSSEEAPFCVVQLAINQRVEFQSQELESCWQLLAPGLYQA